MKKLCVLMFLMVLGTTLFCQEYFLLKAKQILETDFIQEQGLVVTDSWMEAGPWRYVYHVQLSKWTNLQGNPNCRLEKITPDSKIEQGLLDTVGIYPKTQIPVWVLFYQEFDQSGKRNLVQRKNIRPYYTDGYVVSRYFAIMATARQVQELSQDYRVQSLSFFEVGKPLNYESIILQGAHAVQSSVGPYKLRGSGVTVGLGDGGSYGFHLDHGETIDLANGTYNSYGDHGDHTGGIIGGMGWLNPQLRGMAPEVRIVLRKTFSINYFIQSLNATYEVGITSNSYGGGFSCSQNGKYINSSIALDLLAWNNSEYIPVFAAGNSGGNQCGDYPLGNFTVLKGYQSAKDVLTVGMVEKNLLIVNSSSRGPVYDGRLKPEIVAMGRVWSTGNNFNYVSKKGTSMAAPNVAGALALFAEMYKSQNDDSNPPGGLLKAVACNTATDLGRPGPDFDYGFGLVNTPRGVRAIENEQYGSVIVGNGETTVKPLFVPAGVKEVKVMAYWVDRAGSTSSLKALVNDIDIEVNGLFHDEFGNPLAGIRQPWVLDHIGYGVLYNAVRGRDSLNNIEQVTFEPISSSTYYIRITGTEIPLGVQKVFYTWDFIYKDDVTLTHPIGGEKIDPRSPLRVDWDGSVTGDSLSIECSLNGGDTWEMIAIHVAVADRYYEINLADTIVSNAVLIRITDCNGEILDLSSSTFTVMEQPEITSDSSNILTWSDVGDWYTVMRFNPSIPGYEVVVDSLMDTTYTVAYSTEDPEDGWHAVVAHNATSGSSSLRSVAKHVQIDPVLLPVGMISFIGFKDEAQNRLEWEIAGSDNSREFVIQRSCDGEDWSRLDALAIYDMQYRYSFNDEHPERISYYRLKIIDHDESYEYSETKVLERRPIVEVNLYPNPTFGKVNIVTDYDIESLRIFHSNGKKVPYTGSVKDKEIYLNQSGGTYHMEIELNGEIICKTIILQDKT